MTHTPTARFRRRPGVVLSQGKASRFLTDTHTGDVFEVNETAAFVYETAAAGATSPEVVAALRTRYPEIPGEELERDAHDILAEFARRQLLESESEP